MNTVVRVTQGSKLVFEQNCLPFGKRVVKQLLGVAEEGSQFERIEFERLQYVVNLDWWTAVEVLDQDVLRLE